MCFCLNTSVCVRACVFVLVCMLICLFVCAFDCASMFECMRAGARACMCVCACVWNCLCLYVQASMCVKMSKCKSVYPLPPNKPVNRTCNWNQDGILWPVNALNLFTATNNYQSYNSYFVIKINYFWTVFTHQCKFTVLHLFFL